MRKRVKSPYKKAKDKAWDNFSKYIRLRDAFATTGTAERCKCITCGNIYPTFGIGCIQAGHFVSGRNNSILLDERFVNGQCHICNRWKRGEFVKYEKVMLKWWGEEAVKEVKDRSLLVVKISTVEWEEKAMEYEQKYKDLLENPPSMAEVVGRI